VKIKIMIHADFEKTIKVPDNSTEKDIDDIIDQYVDNAVEADYEKVNEDV
jgi:ABC-type polysaccharide transport system permease subunit